jgi:hypothetical protein
MTLKLRHITALALFVWYLVAPPAPYYSSKWSLLGAFDTSEDCGTYLKNVTSQLAEPSPLSVEDQLAHLYAQARCVQMIEPLYS